MLKKCLFLQVTPYFSTSPFCPRCLASTSVTSVHVSRRCQTKVEPHKNCRFSTLSTRRRQREWGVFLPTRMSYTLPACTHQIQNICRQIPGFSYEAFFFDRRRFDQNQETAWPPLILLLGACHSKRHTAAIALSVEFELKLPSPT